MPKIAKELGALEVGRLKEPGLHAVGGVAGLHLQVSPAGSRSWICRITIGGKRRDVGLGSFPGVGLADARRLTREAREKAATGVDPIAERQAAKDALAVAQAARITFGEAAARFIATRGDGWRNAKHRAQWASTLETYADPTLGTLPVEDVRLEHVIKILEPIWGSKTETAVRLRGRIEAVLDWASVRGFRQGENPARWRGHLDKILPAPKKITKVEHHPAVKLDDLHGFITDLKGRPGIAARALEFLILTAARSGEVRGATWAEIDLASRTWTIPGERMKAWREHRVPLCERSMEILRSLPVGGADEPVFKSPRGKFLSDMSVSAVMRRMGRDEVPHGFRSTFRDWAAERTNYPRELAEMALAHTIGNAVEAAYRRGDLFDKRRRMMEAWAEFCSNKPQVGASVTPIRKSRRA